MATMVKLLRLRNEIIDETYSRRNDAEERRTVEFRAVLRIQAWFRGQRIRSYINHLNSCASEIQRKWRGFLARKSYRERLKKHVFIMKLNHYSALATKVQKVWRGYFTRKYIFNYYSRKRYLEGLVVKNEMIRQELEDHAEQQEQMQQLKREKMEKNQLDDWSSSHHYLLSTQVMPGVFNSPYKPYPDELEYHLRNAKISVKAATDKEGNVLDPAWKRYDLPRLDPLPPVQPKPQGPFRDLKNVQKQRYKPFQPSLRVATDFYSLEETRGHMKQEEWVNRLHDNVFLPFSKKSYNPHGPLLHTSSRYGHLPYGTQYFREEFAEKWDSNENFKTVVPPIPKFDRLNDTYSQGQV